MAFRWIEVLSAEDRVDALREAASEAGISEFVVSRTLDQGRCTVRMLAPEIDRQSLLDRLQEILEGDRHWRIVVSGTEAVTPQTEREKDCEQASVESREADSQAASREEVFQRVSQGAALSRDYLMLVALSTVVAGLGLVRDDLATIIGAMVIAPLLGPVLALAFGTAVGDRAMVLRALKSLGAGLLLTLVLAALMRLAIDVPAEGAAEGAELARRSRVDPGAIALALASGTAAALSITSGLSATLVGVMVAAALLPPAAAAGLSLAAGAGPMAVGAALLLGVNLAAVTLAAILTFLAKGIRPRRWHEREGAAQSQRVTIAILVAALAAMSGLMALDAGR